MICTCTCLTLVTLALAGRQVLLSNTGFTLKQLDHSLSISTVLDEGAELINYEGIEILSS